MGAVGRLASLHSFCAATFWPLPDTPLNHRTQRNHSETYTARSIGRANLCSGKAQSQELALNLPQLRTARGRRASQRWLMQRLLPGQQHRQHLRDRPNKAA
jgi:hypothetical protein